MSKQIKASSRLGYLKFYPGDWINDNISLTHEEFGVYMRMVFRYWVRDGLPWTPEEIAEDIGDRGTEHVETIKRILGKKFTKGRGKRWVHIGMDAARTEVREFRNQQADNGVEGNKLRRKSEGEKLIKPNGVANKDGYISPTTTATTATPLTTSPTETLAATETPAATETTAITAAIAPLIKVQPVSDKSGFDVSRLSLEERKARLREIQSRSPQIAA